MLTMEALREALYQLTTPDCLAPRDPLILRESEARRLLGNAAAAGPKIYELPVEHQSCGFIEYVIAPNRIPGDEGEARR